MSHLFPLHSGPSLPLSGPDIDAFSVFWCDYVFSEGPGSDGRKGSRASQDQVTAGLCNASSAVPQMPEE